MANPNKTVAAFRAKVGKDPKVTEAQNSRFDASEQAQDMRRFQAGEMTASEFMSKWA